MVATNSHPAQPEGQPSEPERKALQIAPGASGMAVILWGAGLG